MHKIGVGCTSYNRPECLAKWKEQIAKHTNMDNVLVYIADDSIQRMGVAYRKNECLRALKDCDYIFLFDDDCYPIQDNWEWFFISKSDKHLLFLDEKKHNPIIGSIGYRDCGGVLMYMTKDVIDNVGAFNEKFQVYGFEHAEYSLRIQMYTKEKYAYSCYPNTKDYIYAEDYSNPKHKSSISNDEKDFFVNQNWKKFFNEPIKNVYLPL